MTRIQSVKQIQDEEAQLSFPSTCNNPYYQSPLLLIEGSVLGNPLNTDLDMDVFGFPFIQQIVTKHRTSGANESKTHAHTRYVILMVEYCQRQTKTSTAQMKRFLLVYILRKIFSFKNSSYEKISSLTKTIIQQKLRV